MTRHSWGRYPPVRAQQCAPIAWRDAPLPSTPGYMLAHGMGRSYGDSCLNDGHTLLLTRGLDRMIEFDRARGVLRCEAGVTLAEILDIAVPAGWFLPVTPGTKFATVGGCIANDVHGKNHERAGSFGNHVLRFELKRSDGSVQICAPQDPNGLYHATIGGLGLTGLVTWAEIQLKRVSSARIEAEHIRFDSLEEFQALSAESRETHEYTVAWIDCLASGAQAGRGIFSRGNAAGPAPDGFARKPRRRLGVPMDLPSMTLNGMTVKLFNAAYIRKLGGDRSRETSDYDPFFYPLDAIHGWNRIYGRRGFLQYQCVTPAGNYAVIRELLREIARAGSASFLSVLKEFGSIPSRGLLSFPRPGITLALDFPFRGETTLRLLDRLDDVVREAGGALYPAKDARMSRAMFRLSYPRWEEFARAVDPKFSSGFWRRVTGE